MGVDLAGAGARPVERGAVARPGRLPYRRHLLGGSDRIEAAVRAGEPETAREWLAAFEPWAGSAASAWPRAVALHGRALVADDPVESECCFAEAIDATPSLPARSSVPGPSSRSVDSSGGAAAAWRHERIYARRSTHSRPSGPACGPIRRASSCGRAARRPAGANHSTRDQLTSQELQIARFVSQGLSNRDVAAQLFLSPRTVAFHLRNIFQKLGISSRTEFAALQLDPTAMGD